MRNVFRMHGLKRFFALGIAVAILALSAITPAVAAEKQVITLTPAERGATISPGIFGHLIEPYGRTVDGIWVGPDSSVPNIDGIRMDTLEALRQLKVPVIRFPGGTYADCYHWRDGIGPRDKRPRRRNVFFGGEEDHQFGTDEFLRLCELIGAEAWIKLNPITADLQETLDWMEYCNYDGNTELANLRRENGHPRPYGVKYWQLGNEARDAFTPEQYALLVHQWTFYMAQTDPDARIIVSGSPEGLWNEKFFPFYADILPNGSIALSNLFHIVALKYCSDEQIESTIEMIDQYLGEGAADVVVEEWSHNNLDPPTERMPDFKFEFPWSRETADMFEASGHYEQPVCLKLSIGSAQELHRFMRKADRVKMTTIIYLLNTWEALIKTRGDRMVLTPTYHVFDMFKNYMNMDLIKVDYEGPLDVFAAIRRDGQRIIASIVNTDQSEPIEVSLRFAGDTSGLPVDATAKVLTGDPLDENTFDTPDRVIPRRTKIEKRQNEWVVTCEPFSVTVVSIRGDD